jgi:hypothetical protein
VAKGQYRIHRIEIRHDADLDNRIASVLEDYGTKGLGVSSGIHGPRVPEDPIYRLILETEQTLE